MGDVPERVPCPNCGVPMCEGAGYWTHVRSGVCLVGKPDRASKDACPHHGRLDDGRPDPPAGYCGPLCHMRPGVAEREQASA